MTALAQISQLPPTDSEASLPTWEAIRGAEVPESQVVESNTTAYTLWLRSRGADVSDSQAVAPPLESWRVKLRLPLSGTTMGDVSVWCLEVLGSEHPEEETPWYLEEGMEGMQAAVDRMKHEVLSSINSQVLFSEPVVEQIVDDEGDELTFVVVDVLIPETLDDMVFRDHLFRRLVQVFAPGDQARLAIGVRRLGPRP